MQSERISHDNTHHAILHAHDTMTAGLDGNHLFVISSARKHVFTKVVLTAWNWQTEQKTSQQTVRHTPLLQCDWNTTQCLQIRAHFPACTNMNANVKIHSAAQKSLIRHAEKTQKGQTGKTASRWEDAPPNRWTEHAQRWKGGRSLVRVTSVCKGVHLRGGGGGRRKKLLENIRPSAVLSRALQWQKQMHTADRNAPKQTGGGRSRLRRHLSLSPAVTTENRFSKLSMISYTFWQMFLGENPVKDTIECKNMGAHLPKTHKSTLTCFP